MVETRRRRREAEAAAAEEESDRDAPSSSGATKAAAAGGGEGAGGEELKDYSRAVMPRVIAFFIALPLVYLFRILMGFVKQQEDAFWAARRAATAGN